MTDRPRYHFLPPANWMNDPNGTIFHDGVFHLFYQCNPHRPRWGSIHWGHARSRDLVHWEHLPIALAPDGGLQERHCFSGCCVIAGDGRPAILYTRIGLWSLLSKASRWADQCLAFGDPGLIAWSKHPGNPVASDAVHGGLRVRHWRDPYVWRDGSDWRMVLAGQLAGEKLGSVLLYRSPDLMAWRYEGVLCREDGTLGKSPLGKGLECPNYFRLGERWVLVVSPYGPVIYSVGELRDGRHHGGPWRAFDHGRSFYATNTWVDDRGRTLLAGWIKAAGEGWAGCLSLPREVRLDGPDGLSIAPIAALEGLRREHRRLEMCVAPGEPASETALLSGDSVEIDARYALAAGERLGFELRAGQARWAFGVDFRSRTLQAGGEQARLRPEIDSRAFGLRVFIDRCVIEVFVDGREVMTALLPSELVAAAPFAIIPFVSGGRGTARFDCWRLDGIGLDEAAARPEV